MSTRSIPRAELERVISEDLYNDLRYLLIAEAAWKVIAALGPSGVATEKRLLKLPHHMRTTALDSALLHGRALLVFLTANRDQRRQDELHQGVNWKHYSVWGATKQESKWLNRWSDVLNARLFHISRMRPQVRDPEGISHLNEQASSLAAEVLRCWVGFENSITDQGIRDLLNAAHTKAEDEGNLAEVRVRQVIGV